MKNKACFKKGLSLLTASAVAASMLIGCGKKEEPAATPEQTTVAEAGTETTAAADSEGVTYPVEGAGSFTYGMTLATAWSCLLYTSRCV